MPIFEYQCNECDHEFEKLVTSSNSTPPACPSCSETNVKKLVSAGCVRANGISASSPDYSGASCTPSGG